MNNFTITKKNELVFDPITWNPSMFQRELYLTYGLSVTFPVTEPTTCITIGEDFVIYPTDVVAVDLQADEKLGTPVFTINNSTAVYKQTSVKLSDNEIASKLATLKGSLISSLSYKRKSMEAAGVTVIINGTKYTFDSDRDSQGMLHRTYAFMTDSVNWKCMDNVTWVTLDKVTMLTVIEAITSYIAECFNKESALQTKIDKLDIFGASSFNLDTEWSNA